MSTLVKLHADCADRHDKESTNPNRYTVRAKFCFCKNSRRMIIRGAGLVDTPRCVHQETSSVLLYAGHAL